MESVFYRVTLLDGSTSDISKESGEKLIKLIEEGANESGKLDILKHRGAWISFDLSVVENVDFKIGSSILNIDPSIFTEEEKKQFKEDLEKAFGNGSGILHLDVTYSEEQLIDFGNYLLSDRRQESFLHSYSEIPLDERLKKVTDADLQNFFNK